MASPSWLEELGSHVERQGLPPHYVERLLQELSDHFEDVQEEKMRMDAEKVCTPAARMGDPGDLARFIGSEYRKQSFSQRHPVVTFGVMPVLLLLGTWAGLWAGLLLLDCVLGGLLGDSGALVANGPSVTNQLVIYGEIWVPVALTTVIFCRAARRRRMSWRWPLLTAATLAVFPGMMLGQTTLSSLGQAADGNFLDSVLVIGVPPAITAALLLQSLLPLAIGGWYAWRGYRLQGYTA
jgi:hypothetical protein